MLVCFNDLAAVIAAINSITAALVNDAICYGIDCTSENSTTRYGGNLCQFWCRKLTGFGDVGVGVFILTFPIETAGHPYNSAALPSIL